MIGYLAPNYPLVAAFRALPQRRTRASDRLSRKIFRTAPKLADYFNDSEIMASKGDLDRPISGLALDCRRVMPGNLYFALSGEQGDGGSHIDQAIQRGAVAIVSERIPSGTASRVTYVQVPDARRALAKVSQRYFGFPDKTLDLVGVTGTSGKTTVATLVKHLLSTTSERVGLIGTVNYDLGNRIVPSFSTTPESLDLYGMLAQIRDAGCRQAVLEVSSSGIDQQSVLGLQLGVAVFTNLTQANSGRPHTAEEYFALKARLFNGGTGPRPRAAAVNIDDPSGQRLAGELPAGMKVVTFGENPDAQVRAERVACGPEGTAFRLVWPGGSLDLCSPLIGRYNLSNLLGAFAACVALGRDPAVIGVRLKTFAGVPGRMERIAEGQPFNVLVDYARTESELRSALLMLKTVTPGRVHVVFGCDGQGDRTSRGLMTAAVQECAELAWATSANPRGEALRGIFSDMAAGVCDGARISFVEDRRSAISQAFGAARPGDAVLVAGRGHETFQELAGTVVPFDDRQVARELLADRTTRTA